MPSNLYKFVIEINRELSHEEMNELEIALWAQCEDLEGLQNVQLLHVFPKQHGEATPDGSTSKPTGE